MGHVLLLCERLHERIIKKYISQNKIAQYTVPSQLHASNFEEEPYIGVTVKCRQTFVHIMYVFQSSSVSVHTSWITHALWGHSTHSVTVPYGDQFCPISHTHFGPIIDIDYHLPVSHYHALRVKGARQASKCWGLQWFKLRDINCAWISNTSFVFLHVDLGFLSCRPDLHRWMLDWVGIHGYMSCVIWEHCTSAGALSPLFLYHFEEWFCMLGSACSSMSYPTVSEWASCW